MGRLKHSPFRSELSIGVDWGKKRDPSALCIAHTEFQKDKKGSLIPHFIIHQLRPLAKIDINGELAIKSYEDQTDEVLEAFRTSQIRFLKETGQKRGYLSQFIFRGDITGVGEGPMETVAQRMRDQDTYSARLDCCRFTRGDRITRTAQGYSIGKDRFAARLQQLAQSDRLHFPANHPDQAALISEFMDYTIEVEEDGGTNIGANRPNTHDDQVTALGLACLIDPRPLAAGDLMDRTANWHVPISYDPYDHWPVDEEMS